MFKILFLTLSLVFFSTGTTVEYQPFYDLVYSEKYPPVQTQNARKTFIKPLTSQSNQILERSETVSVTNNVLGSNGNDTSNTSDTVLSNKPTNSTDTTPKNTGMN